MRITRIENQKRHPGRKVVYADDRYLIGLSDEALLRSGIRVGDEVSPERLQELLRTEELFHAKRIALRFISHRPRTVREVRDKLREREVGDDDIATTVKELTRAGLLNDEEFARMFIRDTLALRPVGPLRLKQRLLMLGVERSIVDETVSQAFRVESPEETALSLARRYAKKSVSPKTRADALRLRNRVAAYLGRKGFSWEIIQTVLKQILVDEESPEKTE